MAKISFGGVIEDVVTREEFPLSRAQQVLKNEVVAVLGYLSTTAWARATAERTAERLEEPEVRDLDPHQRRPELSYGSTSPRRIA